LVSHSVILFISIILILINIFLLCSVVFGIFAAYTNANPFSVQYDTSYAMTKILPQGWGFFTKDPRGPINRFYTCNGEQLTQIGLNNSSIKAFGGASRYHRRFNLELHRVQSIVPDSLYVKDDNLTCNLYPIHTILDERGFDYHFVEDGIYAMSVENKKPWLYANKNINYDNEFKIARIRFSNKKDK